MGARLGGRAVIAARLAETPELAEPDGHALAGLLDAEGSFEISRNNRGRNWACSLHMTQRADDASTLLEIKELTGLGTIKAKRAVRGSHPQAIWSINSGLECLRLAEILEMFPLRGRKRHDAAEWVRAVRAHEGGGARYSLAEYAERLRVARRYQEPRQHASPYPASDEPGFIWYFGGFFTGEGSFHLSMKSARAVIKLRRDDRPLLDAFTRITGLGRVYDVVASGTSKPASVWMVLAQPELPEAIELLEAARLRGRKRREFRAWRVGAREFVDAREQGRKRDGSRIEAASQALRNIRAYTEREFTPTGDDLEVKRRVFADILRSWAGATKGELSSTRYAEARRANPHWPTQWTMAAAFGSWPAALEAAGLAHRCTRSFARRLASAPA